MQTPEHPDGNLPSRFAEPLPPAVAHPGLWEELPDLEASAPKPITIKVALRALRRYWWQILLLWGVGSIGLMALAYYKIKPTYDAVAWLKVEPSDTSVLNTTTHTPANDFQVFMETQVQLVTSPDVLGAALHDEDVAALARIRESLDPKAELRDLIQVSIPPKSQLILVSMSSQAPGEGPTIVNAVVESYLEKASTWVDIETRQQTERYREMKKVYEARVQNLRRDLERLVGDSKTAVAADAAGSRSAQVSMEEFRQFMQGRARAELELIEAEASLAALREQMEERRRLNPKAFRAGPPTSEEIAAAATRLVQQDREIADLYRELSQVRYQHDQINRATRKANDPAFMHNVKRQKDLEQNYAVLWKRKMAEARASLTDQAQTGPAETDPFLTEIQTAQLRVAKLQEERAQINNRLDEIQLDTKTEGSEALQAQFKQEELRLADEMLRKVTVTLDSLELEVHGPAKISKIAEAEPTNEPTRDNRLKLMAVAPLGMLAAVVGLFLLVEVRAGRILDPDDVPRRAKLGVLGIVPPLPSLQSAQGPKALRDQRRRFEEFVQSLDHLRVMLCAAGPGPARKRCVLITSACGGEGKTTLAAQLASRCANAGLQTLLVDGDLRRPSLGTLLDVPEGPGLADVLMGEATPESAMVVIGSAGGFHLLPAGSVGQDPSRLLQGERLGQLIARLRDAFDIVILDAPPILPVPDALLLGRWTDGAIMAVRYDSTRYSLLERAKKRLTSVGVTMLGAVVNGVRPPETSYGGYDGYYTQDPTVGGPLAAAESAEI